MMTYASNDQFQAGLTSIQGSGPPMFHSQTLSQKQKKKGEKYYLAHKVSNTEAKEP